ncbi:MAG: hypothetical protein HOP22_01400 [Nitrospiraceae bacterium]|nr:hypothetical protein [Nitrospiraceae bacterium]
MLKSLTPMIPSPTYQKGKPSYGRLLLLSLLCLAGAACSTTAPTGKILFEDQRGTVSFQTMSDRSVRATHPINLEPALLAQLLTGLKIHDERLGPRRTVAGFAWQLFPAPVFTEDQIKFLAPLLAEGLRMAAPDEAIAYRVQTTYEGSNRFQSPATETTAGSLYAHGRQLYVILSQYRYNPMRTNLVKGDIAYRSQEPFDYSGLKYFALRFTPKAALNADASNPPTMEQSTDRFVVVDYQLLDQAHRAAEARSTETLAQEVDTLKQELESMKKQLDSLNPGQDSPKQKPAPLLKP